MSLVSKEILKNIAEQQAELLEQTAADEFKIVDNLLEKPPNLNGRNQAIKASATALAETLDSLDKLNQ